MSGSFSLAEGGNTFTGSNLASISPNLNDEVGRVIHTALDGSVYVYDSFGAKVDHELTVNKIGATDAGYVNGWWSNGTTVVYTPDTDTPATTYNVKIVNTSKPLLWMPKTSPNTKFEGTIILRQI